jgi:3-oxoacyl-[acyl-carrier-protein] synthase-1
VGYPEFLHTLHTHDFPVCEIKQSNEALAIRCGMKPGLPRTAYLSAIAAIEAMGDVRCEMSEVGNADNASDTFSKLLSFYRVGFISGNTLGGMDRSEFFYDEFLKYQGVFLQYNFFCFLTLEYIERNRPRAF